MKKSLKHKFKNFANELNIYKPLTLVLLFVIGFLITFDKPFEFDNHKSVINSFESSSYYRLVVIGSSGCVFSNSEESITMIKNIKKKFREIAAHQNKKAVFTGISLDLNPTYGIQYLNKTGPYDEITTGLSWYNSGILRYIWDVFEGEAATPQIIITRSNFNVRSAGEEIGEIEHSEQMLGRFVGINDMRSFLTSLNEVNSIQEIKSFHF